MAEIRIGKGIPGEETHVFFLRKPGEGRRNAPAGLAEAADGREVAVTSGPGGRRVFLRAVTPRPSAIAALRGAVRAAAESMRRRGVARARFEIAEEFSGLAPALLPQLAQCDYAFDAYKTDRRRGPARLRIDLHYPGARVSEAGLERARAAGAAASWARDLGNTPANDLDVRALTRAVAAAARHDGLRFRALSPGEIRRERMGGLLGVSSGSSRPPGFLVLEHRPTRARASVVLVGKGITFDSGGISIKPAASMGEMKFDMLGAATALAVVRAAHSLRLPIRLTALAPLAENVPSGTSYRPGDILRMRNGKTVEVDNTDAEGRLILGDALSYAERFSPDLVLDFATLTGAIVVALGQDAAGLFTQDDGIARGLTEAGETTGERFWRMPLWDDYRDYLKSDYADMKNTGGRWGGAATAAIFLKEFVPKGTAWAHCDIAGVAHLEKPHAGYAAGATGFGIAAAVEFLRRRF